MRKLRIQILDLIPQGPATSMRARVMNANMASIMPQIIAAWCEQLGHQVRYLCYTGFEGQPAELASEQDLVFITSFTRTSPLAYAVSNYCRRQGAVTVLGGPHARCFPDDARKYFDYVLGLTDKKLVQEVLGECERHRPLGRQLSPTRQPSDLPGVEERWKFVAATLEDITVPRFFEQETTELPACYRETVRQKLGPWWQHLPENALSYDPHAFLHKAESETMTQLTGT